MTTTTGVWRSRMASAVTGSLGVALVLAMLTGRAHLLVRGYFVPVLGVTGLGLLALAWRRPPRPARPGLLLLGLPAVVGLALGPTQVSHVSQGILSGGLGARLGDPSNPLTAGQGGPVSLLQIALAEDQLGAAALVGRQVSVEAQVSGPQVLQRLVMVCCAADARPVALGTTGRRLPADGAWVRASGYLSVSHGNLVLHIDGLVRIPLPTSPIL